MKTGNFDFITHSILFRDRNSRNSLIKLMKMILMKVMKIKMIMKEGIGM
jgi:hypothetical protein